MAAIGQKTDTWGTRFGFLMAAVGSSVGLGNLWRFPFTAGENGGSAFILIYILCVLLLGLPVLMSEYAVGRRGQRSAISGIRHIVETENKPKIWIAMGWIGALASLGIVSFYFVIATWVFDYIPIAFSGSFANLPTDAELLRGLVGEPAAGVADQIKSIDLLACSAVVSDAGLITQVTEMRDGVPVLRDVTAGDLSGCKFSQTTANKFEIICYLAVFIALNVIVLARGIGNGIEKAASILMPAFFVMLMGMVIFAVTTGDAGKALGFLFAPDFSRVSFATIQAAIGQAFFSLGVGSALMVTYGAYLSRETDIPSASGIVATADTVVALIAGLAIFPIVFAFALDPAGGGGLFFVTMPTAFGSMTGGAIVGGLFFTLALFAAFTSSISLLEVGVSWLEDQPWISRQMGAVLLGLILFGCGVGYVYHDTWIGHIDFVTGTIMLPLGGILVALFAGWVLSRQALDEELGSQAVVKLILPLLRYVIPIALMIFLILGTLDNLQDAYRIDLPEFLFPLIGENPQR